MKMDSLTTQEKKNCNIEHNMKSIKIDEPPSELPTKTG